MNRSNLTAQRAWLLGQAESDRHRGDREARDRYTARADEITRQLAEMAKETK